MLEGGPAVILDAPRLWQTDWQSDRQPNRHLNKRPMGENLMKCDFKVVQINKQRKGRILSFYELDCCLLERHWKKTYFVWWHDQKKKKPNKRNFQRKSSTAEFFLYENEIIYLEKHTLRQYDGLISLLYFQIIGVLIEQKWNLHKASGNRNI